MDSVFTCTLYTIEIIIKCKCSQQINYTFVILTTTMQILLQSGRIVEMADALRDNGKIYVVLAVVLTILIGLLAYLFRLDRKISKLEQRNK